VQSSDSTVAQFTEAVKLKELELLEGTELMEQLAAAVKEGERALAEAREAAAREAAAREAENFRSEESSAENFSLRAAVDEKETALHTALESKAEEHKALESKAAELEQARAEQGVALHAAAEASAACAAAAAAGAAERESALTRAVASLAGTCIYCPPRHPTHSELSCLETNGIL